MEQVAHKHKETNETYTKEIATLQPTEQQLKVRLINIVFLLLDCVSCMRRAFMDHR